MRLAALIAFLIFAAQGAFAHTRSESHSAWELNRTAVDLIFTAPDEEINRISPDGVRPSDQAVIDYLTTRAFPIADGKQCPVVPPVVVMPAAPGYRKFDFTFTCDAADPATVKIQIHSDAFYDFVSSHVNFAQIQNAAGDFAEQLLTDAHRTADASAGSDSPLQKAHFLEFVEMGTMHIFTGIDRMSFLLGLVLISRRLRNLVFVVTGFTLGHSLTLALAVTGVLRPHAEYIDALVALTIALIGAENIAVATRKPEVIATGLGGLLLAMAAAKFAGIGELPLFLLLGTGLFSACYLMISGHLKDAGRLRMVITVVFGLIHGFGFASDLTELQLPTGRLAQLLVGFNLGVEVGQLTLVLSATLLVAALARWRMALPRPIVVDVSSAFLVGLGCFWFVSRSF
jgi:hypothetical protein